MARPLSTDDALVNEAEACRRLGINVEELHDILDDHVFNNGERRPAECLFRNSDLVLISYYLRKGGVVRELLGRNPKKQRNRQRSPKPSGDEQHAKLDNVLAMPKRD